MSFLNSIQNQSKKHEFPFDHWEYNNALSNGSIEEIIKKTRFSISCNPINENTNKYYSLCQGIFWRKSYGNNEC